LKNVIKEALALTSASHLADCKVIPWASPIVFFGNLKNARLATVGINPSNREFVDVAGCELIGPERRFPTLSSCGLESWSRATDDVVDAIFEHCTNYFSHRPYELWFNKLEAVISQTGHSYYSSMRQACHLDIVPFATCDKWAALTQKQRAALIRESNGLLISALASSEIDLLVLNGKAVVDCFSQAFNLTLEQHEASELNLNRRASRDVTGTIYRGSLTVQQELGTRRIVRVVGFNHNIQSSFGVTREVLKNLSHLIGTIYNEEATA
jgi:hypothetical protein